MNNHLRLLCLATMVTLACCGPSATDPGTDSYGPETSEDVQTALDVEAGDDAATLPDSVADDTTSPQDVPPVRDTTTTDTASTDTTSTDTTSTDTTSTDTTSTDTTTPPDTTSEVALAFDLAAPATPGAMAKVKPLVLSSPNGNQHVLYLTTPDGDLWYARRTPSGEFERTFLMAAFSDELYELRAGVAFDDGSIRAVIGSSNENSTSQWLFHAMRSPAGEWTLADLGAPGDDWWWWYDAATVDGTGAPVNVGTVPVANNQCDLKLFRFEGGAWQSNTIHSFPRSSNTGHPCEILSAGLFRDGGKNPAIIQIQGPTIVLVRSAGTPPTYVKHTPPNHEFSDAFVAPNGDLQLVYLGFRHMFGSGIFWTTEDLPDMGDRRAFHMSASGALVVTTGRSRCRNDKVDADLSQWMRSGPRNWQPFRTRKFVSVGVCRSETGFSFYEHVHIRTTDGEPIVTVEPRSGQYVLSRGLDIVDWPDGVNGRSVALDFAENPGPDVRFKVAPDGRPHMLLNVGDGNDRRLVVRALGPSGWFERAEIATRTSYKSGMAFGSDGSLHVAYSETGAGRVQHVRIEPNGVVHREVATIAAFGVGQNRWGWRDNMDIAVADDGTVHLLNWAKDSAAYLVRGPTGWAGEELEGTDTVSGRYELLLNGAGEPVIVAISDWEVKFGRRGPSGWQFASVAGVATRTDAVTFQDAARNVCVAHLSHALPGNIKATCLNGSVPDSQVIATGTSLEMLQGAAFTSDGLQVFGYESRFSSNDPRLLKIEGSSWTASKLSGISHNERAMVAGPDGTLWFMYRRVETRGSSLFVAPY